MPEPDLMESALLWSGALRRKILGDAPFGAWLGTAAANPLTASTVQKWFEELSGGDRDTALQQSEVRRALRRLRARVFFTLLVRDINGSAPLDEVTTAMTALGDLAIRQACKSAMTDLSAAYGVPRESDNGAPQELLIIGMGKLGGQELNVSSDIDLIMLYGNEGETTGRRKISHHEFYGRVTRQIVSILSEIDADGQVFRTDLRLRPDGDSGPLAWSLEALENYLVSQGREWERYAWLKSRPIPCRVFPDSAPSDQVRQLKALCTPFVYRKYFDFDALAALRSLRQRIRQDWQRRALARAGVDYTHNIKLGDGGIREVEFVVQLPQLIRGGRMPSLQQRGLLNALHAQEAAGLITAANATRLESAYRFLRRTEHMLQYREDEQTHLLPRDSGTRAGLARAFGSEPDEFEAALASHRAFVTHAFCDAFRLAGMEENGSHTETRASQDDDPGPLRDQQTTTLLGDQAPMVAQRAEALLDSHRIQGLPRTSRRRVETLLPAAIEAASKTSHPAQTAIRLLDLIEQIAQRSAYLALLAEYPETLARVARIVDSSPWASQYLSHYPLLLDSLIEWRSLLEPPDIAEIRKQLSRDLDARLLANGEPDIEQQMNSMRDLQHQVTFQLLAQDLEGILSIEKLADQLSALADALLAETIERAWPLVQGKGQNRKNLAAPRFAIIAYGKLGGKELGYASDLDLVFLYDDAREDAIEIYTRLGRRVASWLSTMTSSGRLYEIDLRLRPDGEAGLLVTSLQAFAQYQTRHAWSWEHQAITRARYAAGDCALGARFEEIRRQVLLLPRDMESLKDEVRTMRQKISAGHPNRSGDFDLKHDRGGMVDVEFVTQYLVLCHAAAHPVLLDNLGNIALLQLAAKAGLIPTELAVRAANAYRELRRVQHALRLQGAEKARVSSDSLTIERSSVKDLWDMVIGD